MAALNNRSIIAQALSGKPAAGQTAGARPQADVFANIGLTVELNGEPVFLSLPFGLPLDTMSKLIIRGNNEEWNEQAQVRNEFLDSLVEMANGLEPGEGKVITKLEVQIYRRKEQQETATNSALLGQVLSALGTE